MKFLLIKAGKKAEVIELKGKETIDYLTMKKYLEIDSPVTVVERKIGNRHYDLWIDDEGLLKPEEKRIVSGVLIDPKAQELLVGNMLILKHDNEGNSIGLSDEDIAIIKNPVRLIDMDLFNKFHGKGENTDIVFTKYYDGGKCTIKAHSNYLIYGL